MSASFNQVVESLEANFKPKSWYITYEDVNIEVSEQTFDDYKYPIFWSKGTNSEHIGILVKRPTPLKTDSTE